MNAYVEHLTRNKEELEASIASTKERLEEIRPEIQERGPLVSGSRKQPVQNPGFKLDLALRRQLRAENAALGAILRKIGEAEDRARLDAQIAEANRICRGGERATND